MLKFKLWILIPLIMLSTVIAFTMFIFYGSYQMVLENSKIELKGTVGRLNEVFDNFRFSNRLKAVNVANSISLVQSEMRQKKILNSKGQIDKNRMNSIIMGKIELNFNPKTEYIIAYYDIGDKALLSTVEDEILQVIISSPLFDAVKENKISCDIFTHRNKIFIVALAPVFMSDTIAGSAIVVKMVDDRLAYEIRDITGYDISMFSGDNLIGSTFRQTAPEVLVNIMQSSDTVLLHGKMRGNKAPFFPQNIPAMITVFQDLVPEKNIKLAVTMPLEAKFSDLRDIQFIALVVLIGVLIIGVIVSFSISRTIYTSVGLMNDALVPAIKGNLSVQIPETKIPSPFDELVRNINKLLFVAREKISTPSKPSTIFSDIPREDVKRTFTGEIRIPTTPSKPISKEIGIPPKNQSAEVKIPKLDEPAKKDEPPKEVSSRPLSTEIFVGNELSSEDVGQMIEDDRNEEYNPDATMVASIDEIEALDKAKQANKAAELDEFRKLFDKYIAMRLDNGESIENLNFDNFIEKIKNTRSELIKKGNYRDVKFDVIIKNNKVTLKANPLK